MARSAAIALGVLVVLVLVGCSAPRPLPAPTPSASESVGPTGDGVLRIGTLFSMSGDVSSTGAGMVAAVEVAVRDVNAAGGVLGQPVEAFYRDAGSADGAGLEAAFAGLVARGIDVVMAPSNAALAERLLPLAADAGVVVMAPSTPISTSSGTVFSLMASAEQQAAAIVDAIAEDGGESVAIITTGDALGLSFERAARVALESREMRLAAVEQLDAATNPSRLAFSVAGARPDAIILASSASLSAQHPAVITALADRGVRGDQWWMTAPALSDYSSTVAPGLLEGARGVREGAPTTDELFARLRQSDPALVSAAYASETYDAVILVALAAELAGDDSGARLAPYVRDAASEGIACSSFGECMAVLATEPQAEYQGLSGPVTFSDQSGVIDGAVSLYQYSADNRAELVGPLGVIGR